MGRERKRFSGLWGDFATTSEGVLAFLIFLDEAFVPGAFSLLASKSQLNQKPMQNILSSIWNLLQAMYSPSRSLDAAEKANSRAPMNSLLDSLQSCLLFCSMHTQINIRTLRAIYSKNLNETTT